MTMNYFSRALIAVLRRIWFVWQKAVLLLTTGLLYCVISVGDAAEV